MHCYSPLAEINNLLCLFAFATLPREARNSRTEAWKEGNGGKKDSGMRVRKIDDKQMMLHSHSDTHLPLLPYPSFQCREKLKQVDPRFFFSFLSRPFLLPPHQAIAPCLSVCLSLSSSHSPGHCMGQDGSHDRLRDEPPTIRHSSHPTNDSCLYPLTLSPLHFSWKTMCCMQR